MTGKITALDGFKKILSINAVRMGVLRDEVKIQDFMEKELKEEDFIDALADTIVFTVGALLKKDERVPKRFMIFIPFQVERRLHLLQYDAKTELEFRVEEAIECLGFKSKEARELAKVAVSRMGEDRITISGLTTRLYKILDSATSIIGRLGYDVDKVLEETAKHINSRTGKLIDGKFVKDDDAVVYEPNYKSCKIEEK